MRSCSLACYKLHKPTHTEEIDSKDQSTTQLQPKKDRPGTTQRVAKVDFTGFEKDKEFIRLLERYPILKVQLQTVYGLTLEPGPEDARTWNKNPLPPLPGYAVPNHRETSSRGRGRSGRGDRGGRNRGGWNAQDVSHSEDREHGRWTQEKGDREAVKMVSRMKDGSGDWRNEDEPAEGIREFVELVKMRFGVKEDVEGI